VKLRDAQSAQVCKDKIHGRLYGGQQVQVRGKMQEAGRPRAASFWRVPLCPWVRKWLHLQVWPAVPMHRHPCQDHHPWPCVRTRCTMCLVSLYVYEYMFIYPYFSLVGSGARTACKPAPWHRPSGESAHDPSHQTHHLKCPEGQPKPTIYFSLTTSCAVCLCRSTSSQRRRSPRP